MSLEVMIIVLFSAVLHASWNALIRKSVNTLHNTVLLVLGAAFWTLFILPQFLLRLLRAGHIWLRLY